MYAISLTPTYNVWVCVCFYIYTFGFRVSSLLFAQTNDFFSFRFGCRCFPISVQFSCVFFFSLILVYSISTPFTANNFQYFWFSWHILKYDYFYCIKSETTQFDSFFCSLSSDRLHSMQLAKGILNVCIEYLLTLHYTYHATLCSVHFKFDCTTVCLSGENEWE